MNTNFLQANLNHCAAAQNLMIQAMAQWDVGVAVVAEPYRIPLSSSNWAGDSEGLVAIVTRPSAGIAPLQGIGRGRGCVAVSVGPWAVVGAYCSPNRSLSEFETFLAELGALVRRAHPAPVLVAGDFNAKSASWGSPATDARGEALEDWLVATGLVLLNRGTAQTCVRQRGGSIVDLTLATPALASRVRDWRVLEGAETLSDHLYISFNIAPLQDRHARGESRSPVAEVASTWPPRTVLPQSEQEFAFAGVSGNTLAEEHP